MKILFLIYHGFSEASGISKKIHYQVKGLRENGHEVRLCYYGFDAFGHRCRYVDDVVIRDYGRGKLAGLRQRFDYGPVYDYCKLNGIQFVYARCFQNASPVLVRFFKRLNQLGIKSVTEIPTYPYDQEFTHFSFLTRLELKIDQLFRRSLSRQMAAIVTFSDAERIFGQRTIRISNGVDFDAIPLHRPTLPQDTSINLIGVAEVHLWHAYDRLLRGLGEYYRHTAQPRDVRFHVVGGVWHTDMDDFKQILAEYHIEDKVVFYGQLFGEQLDEVFNKSQFAIGSLGRHRSGITVIKTLKNREYATRGLPFIYSEQDADFDHQPYVLKAPADESPIDVQQIVDFVDTHHFQPQEIRSTVTHLTWKIQMQKVIEEVWPTE